MDDELPLDPDLDDLPPELEQHDGPLFIRARDPHTGELYVQPITREELGAAFADARRAREDDDA